MMDGLRKKLTGIGCNPEDWYRDYEERKMSNEETLPHK